MAPLLFGVTFGAPGFEPGVARSQSENVSRYTTPRFCIQCLVFGIWYLEADILTLIKDKKLKMSFMNLAAYHIFTSLL